MRGGVQGDGFDRKTAEGYTSIVPPDSLNPENRYALSPAIPLQELDRLARTFHRFAGLECPGMSALYESLCHGMAEDRELLAIAADARPGQPAPNLFMAAGFGLAGAG